MKFILLLLLCAISGCSFVKSDKTRIKVAGGDRPVFEVAGGGSIVNIVLRGPQQRPGNDAAAFTVWEIRPGDATSGRVSVSDLGSLKYGEIPQGFKQLIPEDSLPPPPLVEGQRYLMQIYTNDAAWGELEFEIRRGVAVETTK
jgi:hypothetical protein